MLQASRFQGPGLSWASPGLMGQSRAPGWQIGLPKPFPTLPARFTPRDPHRVRGASCLQEALASRRAAGTAGFMQNYER